MSYKIADFALLSPSVSFYASCWNRLIDMSFDKFLIIDAEKETVEIPNCFLPAYTGPAKRVSVVPIMITSEDPKVKKNFSSFINEVMKGYSRRNGFQRIKVSDRIYHALPGIILDGNKRPLMMMTTVMDMTGINEDNRSIKHIRTLCRVSPRVFNEDGVVEKGIRKHIIPACMNADSFLIKNWMTPSKKSGKISVLIEDFDYMFISPEFPSKMDGIDEYLNNVIKDNLDATLNNILR